LPIGHDEDVAAGLRADGWRTVAALSEADQASGFGCQYILAADGPQKL
jgi:ATP phosphoribosyltransferase regulatory subunit